MGFKMKYIFLVIWIGVLNACTTSATSYSPRIERLVKTESQVPLNEIEKAKLTELNAQILREQEQKITEARASETRIRELQGYYYSWYWPGPYSGLYYRPHGHYWLHPNLYWQLNFIERF